MPNYCLFNRLPVELLHTLFEYFPTHEVFLTFSDVSNYVNSVLYSYSAYRLDFTSIGKAHLDLFYRHIRAEQVISLTLSILLVYLSFSSLVFKLNILFDCNLLH
jgi:hypothetical protein